MGRKFPCPDASKAEAWEANDPAANDGSLMEKLKHNASIALFILANEFAKDVD